MTDHRQHHRQPTSVACPTCKQGVAWSMSNAHRPFCSERCKTEDFIAWSNEQQVIPEHADNEQASLY